MQLAVAVGSMCAKMVGSRGEIARVFAHACRSAGCAVPTSSPALRSNASSARLASANGLRRGGSGRLVGRPSQRNFHATAATWQSANSGMAAWHPGVIVVPQQTAYVRTKPACLGSKIRTTVRRLQFSPAGVLECGDAGSS